MARYAVQVQSPGTGAGQVLALSQPLSFWGGVDGSGRIVDTHHPAVGADLAGRVLVMAAARGSSSSSSVLAELIRTGAGPAAIVLGGADPIVALGAIVADELYGIRVPVVTADRQVLQALADAAWCSVHASTQDAWAEVGQPVSAGS
ncbi:aconitase X swivel domain-containing protein [Actinomycetota bacterium]